MKNDHNRRLIEVSLPLKAISAQSARERSVRPRHISALHIWWARRPLAAMPAAIFASLIPTPDPSTGLRAGTDEERERLEEPIATIVDWDQVKDVTGLNIYNQKRQGFEFRPGPVLNQVLLERIQAEKARREAEKKAKKRRQGKVRKRRQQKKKQPRQLELF
jgi:adenine-specific DNA methylase